jgi:hypothetical protein
VSKPDIGTALQKVRNQIIHQGTTCRSDQANHALDVSVAVFELIVRPMLSRLGLHVINHDEFQSLQG